MGTEPPRIAERQRTIARIPPFWREQCCISGAVPAFRFRHFGTSAKVRMCGAVLGADIHAETQPLPSIMARKIPPVQLCSRTGGIFILFLRGKAFPVCSSIRLRPYSSNAERQSITNSFLVLAAPCALWFSITPNGISSDCSISDWKSSFGFRTLPSRLTFFQ